MAKLLLDNQLTPLGRALRDMGISYKHAARAVGIHHKSIEGYCKKNRCGSRTPTPEMLRRICAVLGLDETQFATGQRGNRSRYAWMIDGPMTRL